MNHKELYIQGMHATRLYCQAWLPEDEPPRALLLIVHGYGDHSGRYQPLAEYFTAKGIAVYGYDHRGHGRSGGYRGDVKSFSDFLNDLFIVVTTLSFEHPDLEIFLVGHSMGGLVATLYASDHPETVAGLLLSGACIVIPKQSNPSRGAMPGLIARLFPHRGISKLDSTLVCRASEAKKEAYDPLMLRGKMQARIACEIAKAAKMMDNSLKRVTLPLLAMHGSKDCLTDPEGSRRLCELAGTEDTTLKVYDGRYHELFNDQDATEVFDDMAEWLESRISPQKVVSLNSAVK